jgi:glycosyltransferase involved in cell wall biosynthesis
MRVLQVVTLLSPDGAFGGPARVALNQSAELLALGHNVTVAAACRGFPAGPTELDGVPVQLFDVRSLIPDIGLPWMTSPGLAKWFRNHAVDYDVVHIHFGRDLVVLPVARLARRKGIPYVLQTHGMVTPSTNPLATPLDIVWTRKILRAARAVLALTDLERAQLEQVARTRLRLVDLPNGVPDYPAATIGPGPPEVLFVARMHARKRPLVFAEMARVLLDDGIDARFALVGPDGGEGPALRAAIDGDSRISWEGALAPADVPKRLAKARVYVLPSVREPYPMAVLEAMAVGVPVVVPSDCGLAPVVARADCGIVVLARTSSGDATGEQPSAFAAAVTSILSEPDLARMMGERGRRTAHTEFGMRAIAERLTAIYAECAIPPSPAPAGYRDRRDRRGVNRHI